MSYVYHNGKRYEYDNGASIQNKAAPFLPAEIISIVGTHCDRPTLKALRRANKLYRYAVEPIFNTFFHHVILRHNVGAVTASARNLLCIANDKIKCKLVTKVTIVIESNLSFDNAEEQWVLSSHEELLQGVSEEPWVDQLNSREEQRLIESELATLLVMAFMRLRSCAELVIQLSEATNNWEVNEVKADVFTHGAWFVVFHACGASKLIRSLTTCYYDDCTVSRLLPPPRIEPGGTYGSLLINLTKIELCIRSVGWPSWYEFFESIANVEELSLIIGPEMAFDCGDSLSDSEYVLHCLSSSLYHTYTRLSKLSLDVHACCFQELCACLEVAYSKVAELRVNAYTYHFSRVLQLVASLNALVDGSSWGARGTSMVEYFELEVVASYWMPWLDEDPTWESDGLHREGRFANGHERNAFLRRTSADLHAFISDMSDDNFEVKHPHQH